MATAKTKRKDSAYVVDGSADEEDELVLLAICAAESDTRMAWLLNRALHLDFVHYDDVAVPVATEAGEATPQLLALFSAASAALKCTCILIANRYGQALLVKELPQVDFLLKVPRALRKEEADALCAAIRAIPSVSACLVAPPKLNGHPLLVGIEG
ncbi:MAG: IPExxxVDY family protein [Prevotellaceae bacterium]|jgi:hypothetical protein|nr:IPExxxVDY family protein [Prevotellaceae bacterium]